jgi:hypothetical protein
VGEFTEIESGKRSDRPKLAEALKACRLQGAKLVIAKLDRLARNVAFISNLMESNVEFEAVDFPQANRQRPERSSYAGWTGIRIVTVPGLRHTDSIQMGGILKAPANLGHLSLRATNHPVRALC